MVVLGVCVFSYERGTPVEFGVDSLAFGVSVLSASGRKTPPLLLRCKWSKFSANLGPGPRKGHACARKGNRRSQGYLAQKKTLTPPGPP